MAKILSYNLPKKMHREWIVTFSCYMSKLHFLPNEKLYFSPIKYIYIKKKKKKKKNLMGNSWKMH